jgi:hypothetical protein
MPLTVLKLARGEREGRCRRGSVQNTGQRRSMDMITGNRSKSVFRIRIRIRIHRIHMFLGLLDPNSDPLVRGMDPRIRIHSKMSWIRNTAANKYVIFNFTTFPPQVLCIRLRTDGFDPDSIPQFTEYWISVDSGLTLPPTKNHN